MLLHRRFIVVVEYLILLVSQDGWTYWAIAACVTVTLALCIRRKRNQHWTNEWYKQTALHTRVFYDIHEVERVQQKQQFVCGWMVISFDQLLKITTSTIAETNKHIREATTNSPCPLRYAIWPHWIILKNWNFPFGHGYYPADTRQPNGSCCAVLSTDTCCCFRDRKIGIAA